MSGVLLKHPYLAQLVFKRQPWNELEKEAGGIVECHPDAYTECTDGENFWTEHSLFFTTNPSLYSAKLCEYGWPLVDRSEGVFSHFLLEEGKRFAFWGKKFDPPKVEHIGFVRTGKGY